MKLIKYTAACVLLSGAANAQGLFNINANETESESSPLRYNANVAFGYDDNINPTSGANEESSSYIQGSVGANLIVRGEQTSWDLNATLGSSYYFDSGNADSTIYNGSLAVNFNHRINERLRFVNRSFFNYGLDLASFFGPVTSRRVDEYTYFSTDNSIGYRWTDRFATYTGVSVSLLNYDGSTQDVNSYAFYNQFRYILNEQTTLTASVRYTFSDFDNDDSSRVGTSVGFEHNLNETTTLAGDVGLQFGDSTSASLNLNYIYNVNSQLKGRVFARYGQEDTDTVFFGGRYEDKTSFRLGAAADYMLSPRVTLTAGGVYTQSDYKDGGLLPDGDWDLFSIYLRASYKVSDNLSVRASVNHTTSDASVIPNRDYDRNRYELGLNYTF